MSSNGNHKKHTHARDLLTEEQQHTLRSKVNKIEKLRSEIVSLSKPLLQSGANWPKHVTTGTLAIFQDEESWNSINRIHKRPKIMGDVKGSSWSSIKDTLNLNSEDESRSESESSTDTVKFNTDDMVTLGSMPMEEETIVVKCSNCQRPVLPSKFRKHAETCLGDRLISSALSNQEYALKSSDKKRRLRPGSIEDTDTDTESNGKPILEKKKSKKLRRGKAPLDLDKQCGVIYGPDGLPCTRSITCKTHSMSAKRAVEGRSQPYNVLLAAYQKKPIIKSIGNDIVLNDSEQLLKHHKKLQEKSLLLHSNKPSKSEPLAKQGKEEEFYADSDEELENVMQALQFSQPRPLAEKHYSYTKRKRQCIRLRTILLDAITPKIGIENDGFRHS
ncbi:Putative Sgf73p [Rhizopus microsporus]|nr:Putative Sgf73p [Rhizopus microsporus]